MLTAIRARGILTPQSLLGASRPGEARMLPVGCQGDTHRKRAMSTNAMRFAMRGRNERPLSSTGRQESFGGVAEEGHRFLHTHCDAAECETLNPKPSAMSPVPETEEGARISPDIP